jgi:hypothetical protein
MKLNGDMIRSFRALISIVRYGMAPRVRGASSSVILKIIHKLTSTIPYHNMCPLFRRIYFYLCMFYMAVRAVVEEEFMTYELQNHNID